MIGVVDQAHAAPCEEHVDRDGSSLGDPLLELVKGVVVLEHVRVEQQRGPRPGLVPDPASPRPAALWGRASVR
jgi:hypothetical protein